MIRWAELHSATESVLISASRKGFLAELMGRGDTQDAPGLLEATIAGVMVAASPALIIVSGFHGNTDPVFMRYFTLEHDYVLAKQANRTVLAEREGQKHTRRGDGPALTGNNEADAKAFVDCFMELIVPTKVTRR